MHRDYKEQFKYQEVLVLLEQCSDRGEKLKREKVDLKRNQEEAAGENTSTCQYILELQAKVGQRPRRCSKIQKVEMGDCKVVVDSTLHWQGRKAGDISLIKTVPYVREEHKGIEFSVQLDLQEVRRSVFLVECV